MTSKRIRKKRSFKKRVLKKRRMRAVLAAVLAACAGPSLRGQGDSTASRNLEISAFGGITGSFTGLEGGRNISFTGGVDVGFHPFYGLLPAVELRGLYPFASGSVDDQKNILGGLRIEKRHRGARLYGDVLWGRGEINYVNGGHLNPAGDFRYLSSTSSVLSPGAGVSLDVTPLVSVFADAQFQRYETPVTASGHLWAKPVTVGVTYRFPFLKHRRPY